MTERKERTFDENIYEHPDVLGEHPVGVPVQRNVPTEQFVRSKEEFFSEVNEGEVGRWTRKLQKKAKFVAVARGGASHIKTFVANHREHITGAAIIGASVGAGVATVILLDEMREHALPKLKRKSSKKTNASKRYLKDQ